METRHVVRLGLLYIKMWGRFQRKIVVRSNKQSGTRCA
ncbi:MAG: hypothetical protein JWQ23_2002 [Herminiimonas sp.]|nr:hypothetical protein [Herminiimonas sp.]